MSQAIQNLQLEIEERIVFYANNLNGIPCELYEPLSYMLKLGGKRMRPLLVLLACDLFDKPVESAINAAIAVEVLHNFTLIHDDIMDNAPIRRKKETVHKKWNVNVAILAGDAMMIKSYQLLLHYKPEILHQLLSVFNKTALEVCEGQQLDMNYETSQANIEEYLKMIELKTAVLLGTSLKMGAIVAHAPEQDALLLWEFGKNIGIAFQLQDDILDSYGDPEKFGKQIAGDIIANKKTFLYLKALEQANEKDKQQLKYLFSTIPSNSMEKITWVLEVFQKYKVKEAAQFEMEKYFQKAISNLEAVKVDKSKKQHLFNLAESLMAREI
ncbi:MAG: polyprenyl synthetase family protein [Bacteroidetes bacterium]|nr:polyprenyl synthetase family protein [Bacteroidota bacterium]HET6245642.1 polyprenyl synthetase family protein [Bacteroidia bacterium]